MVIIIATGVTGLRENNGGGKKHDIFSMRVALHLPLEVANKIGP